MAVGVGLEDSVVDEVAVPVRDCELLDVSLRVAELLGVDVPVEVGVMLDEREAELLGVTVRVAELLEVPLMLGVTEALHVADGEVVAEKLGVALRELDSVAVWDGETLGAALPEAVVVAERVTGGVALGVASRKAYRTWSYDATRRVPSAAMAGDDPMENSSTAGGPYVHR